MSIFRILFLIVFIFIGTVYASTSNKIRILHATENIKFLSEKIAQEYIYFYSMPYKTEVLKEIHTDMEKIDESIRLISMLSKDTKVKRILSFFDYEKENINDVLLRKPTKEYASKLLEFSDSVSEGTKYLRTYAAYDYNEEESMFLLTQNVKYLSQKFLKYYIALSTDIDPMTLHEKIQDALKNLKEEIKIMQSYSYPQELNNTSSNLSKYTTLYQHIYNDLDIQKTPTISRVMTHGFYKTVKPLAAYHQLNQ